MNEQNNKLDEETGGILWAIAKITKHFDKAIEAAKPQPKPSEIETLPAQEKMEQFYGNDN